MRSIPLILSLVLTLLTGTSSSALAEGKFLEGCYPLKGHEQQFKKTTVVWLAEQQGETIVAYTVLNKDGKTAICGLYLNNGAVPLSDLNLSLSKSEIKVGRQTLIRNLSFFKNACNGGGCRLCAPCFLTQLDWKPAYSRARLNLIPTENFQIE